MASKTTFFMPSLAFVLLNLCMMPARSDWDCRYGFGLGGSPSVHVSDVAALALLPISMAYVRRDGYRSGDGSEADYVLRPGACPLKKGAGDGGSQVGLTGPGGNAGQYIGCAYGVFSGSGDTSINVWGCAEDSDGTPGNGTDSTACLQAAIAWASSNGRRLRHPGGHTANNGPGMLRVTAPITITEHIYLEGDYCELAGGNYVGLQTGSTLPSPGPGSIIYFDHPGKGFIVGNRTNSTEGVVIANECTWRNQPPLPTGSDGDGAGATWMPAANDYDIVENSDDLRLEHVTLINPTSAVLVNGGRMTTYDVRGQFLTNGFHIDGAKDVVRLLDTHAFPFYSQNAAVLNYMRGNQTLIYTGRADGFRIEEMYAVVGGRCWRIGTDAANWSTLGAVVNTLSCDDFGLGGILADGTPSVGGLGQVDVHSYSFAGSAGGFRPGPAIDIENGFKMSVFGLNVANSIGSSVVLKNGAAVSIYANPVILDPNTANGANSPVFSVDPTSYLSLYGSVQPTGAIPSSYLLWSITGTITRDGIDPRTGLYAGSGSDSTHFTITVPAGNGSSPGSYRLPLGTGSITMTDTTTSASAMYVLGGSMVSQPLTGALASSPSTSGFLTGTPSGANQYGVAYDPRTGYYNVYSSYPTKRTLSLARTVTRNDAN